MKFLAAPFKQLLERRLWPVAVLLVAALAAVPMVLAADPEPAGPATGATASAGGMTEPIVSRADAARTDTERKVLGSAKNPFRPAVKAQPVKEDKLDVIDDGSGAARLTGGAAGAGAGGTDAGSSDPATPSTPVVTATPEPKPTFELYSLSVRFGPSTGPLTERTLERLTGLPRGRRPALLYLGLKKDHKTAVFMVDATAEVDGDGHCNPSPTDCQTLTMKAGDTEFIDTASGNQFELDLLKVHTSTTTDASAAEAARAAVAEGGRAYLRRNAGRLGRYRYSSATGLLGLVPQATWKREAAAAARAEAARELTATSDLTTP
jgi:hypothetical protein